MASAVAPAYSADLGSPEAEPLVRGSQEENLPLKLKAF